MAKFCDRSPCAPLMTALGEFVFGSPEGFVIVIRSEDIKREETEVEIEYCPFCGTRLDEVPQVQIEKFMRPRRRKNAKPQASV